MAEERGEFSTLAIVDGPEKGLKLATLRPNWRVWASISVSNLVNLTWPGCADRVLLFQDNDADQSAFYKGLDHWAGQGGNHPLI
ncbi:MAG: toprim domain-containing protein, partial [Verrucomicrobiota bacterium]